MELKWVRFLKDVTMQRSAKLVCQGTNINRNFPFQTDLHLDWDGSPLNYTCYHEKEPFPIVDDLEAIVECDNIPENYMVIQKNDALP